MKKTFAYGVAGLLALSVAACGGEGTPTEIRPGPLARVEVVGGDAQTAPAGAQLSVPLVVKATDANGRAVSGQALQFVVVNGNGSVSAGEAQSNSAGMAQTSWTVGTIAGEAQKLEVRAADPTTGSTVVYATMTAIVTAGAPAQLVKVFGDAQAGLIAAPLTDSLEVKVLDGYGNRVPNAVVTWTSGDGGSLSPASSTTRVDGTTRAQWTTGASVQATAAARVAGVPQVGFTATAEVTEASHFVVTKISGDAQTVAVGAFTTLPYVLSVKLPDGRPIVGVRAGWWTTVGNGASTLTDGSGIAALVLWGGQEKVGTKAITAGVVGGGGTSGPIIGQTVPFSITITTGAPAWLTIEGKGSGGRLSITYDDWVPGTAMRINAAPAGSQLIPLDSVRVLITDIGGNPTPGAKVTWRSSAGAVRPSTSTAAGDGIASTHFVTGLDVTRVWATLGTVADTGVAVPLNPVNVNLVIGVGALTLAAGATSDVVVQVKDLFQAALDVDSDYLTWTSSNPAVATAAPGPPGSPAHATISARSAGTATLTAAIGSVTGTITVTVTP